MPATIVMHRIKDFTEWKPIFDADKARRESHGIKDLVVGRKSDDANLIYLVFETETATVMQGFVADPATKQLMGEAGVIGEPGAIFMD